MSPKHTFELRVEFNNSSTELVKEQLVSWLKSQGIESFVEGVLEGLDLDHESVDPEENFYEDLGGGLSPLSLFSYDQEFLLDLNTKIGHFFSEKVNLSFHKMETEVWTEGWKESFKPIETKRFYIYPPWEKKSEKNNLLPVLIDPGMAFGTGQHATTQVCLEALEKIEEIHTTKLKNKRLLDVGTGSGILAISAKMLGINHVDSCDIDPNALIASQRNAKENKVSFPFWKGSLPTSQYFSDNKNEAYDIVIANILFVVLEKILPQLVDELSDDGILILSGLLDEQKESMLEATKHHNLILIQELSLSGWTCLILRSKK